MGIGLKAIDPRKDKRFKGSIVLPSECRRKMKVCVLGNVQHCEEAEALGLDSIGLDELKGFKRNKKRVKQLASQYDAFLAPDSTRPASSPASSPTLTRSRPRSVRSARPSSSSSRRSCALPPPSEMSLSPRTRSRRTWPTPSSSSSRSSRRGGRTSSRSTSSRPWAPPSSSTKLLSLFDALTDTGGGSFPFPPPSAWGLRTCKRVQASLPCTLRVR